MLTLSGQSEGDACFPVVMLATAKDVVLDFVVVANFRHDVGPPFILAIYID
ncbi:hypothetical protein LSH36_137g06058 [Paralvinella palmiformis]|uniref:Uncharacterized protein n=1 Tax=Paralvinella palmiformis TaxID=53620 RepID=A0AAD9JVU1_9ANNE|nr:hypothetical protein LSH36_137g06058 [Paralvinella palmiformis]